MKKPFSNLINNRVRHIAGAILKHDVGFLAITTVALIGGFGVFSKGANLTTRNMLYVVVQSTSRGIIAVGQALVILTGGIDLSVSGVATFCMGMAALRITGTTGFPVDGLALMALIGAGVGTINGLAVSRLRMPPLIVTFASWIIFDGLTLYLTKGHDIIGLPRQIAIFGQGNIGGIPIAVGIFTGVYVAAYLVLNYTTFGRSVYAVGGNPISAWLCGINTKRIQLSVYIISGLCAALGSLIILSRTMVETQIAAYGLELDSIASAAIGGISLMGGRGSILGVVLGTLIIGIIRNGMSILAIHAAWQRIVTGIIIFIAVASDYIRRRQ